MHHKNALVTGGLRGIGRSIVDTLVARGDHVFVFDCTPSSDPAVHDLIGNGVVYIQVDVSSVESIKQGFILLDDYLKHHQKPFVVSDCVGNCIEPHATLDILINNAGITRDTLALRMSEQDWDSVIDVNLKGTFFCIQHALKRMIKQQKSYIINISSIVGKVGNPGQANYAASKAGIMALTKTIAQEYASRNVLVNAIAPGFIQTPMTELLSESIKQKTLEHIPLRRFGSPSDIANLVAFLSSGNADYMTGLVIDVTGGM